MSNIDIGRAMKKIAATLEGITDGEQDYEIAYSDGCITLRLNTEDGQQTYYFGRMMENNRMMIDFDNVPAMI